MSNRFTPQLSLQSSPFSNADSPRAWAPERPTSSVPRSPPQGISAGNALYQSTLTSWRRSTLPPVLAKDRPGYYLSATEGRQLPDHEQATELANRTRVNLDGNEVAPIPYDVLYPSGPSGPSTSAIEPFLSLNVTRSRSLNQGRDVDVGNPLSSPPPPPSEARFLTAREEREQLRQIYEAQDAAARRPCGTTVGGPPPPYHLLDGSSTPAARPSAPLPSPPVTTGPQPMTAAQEKALLKAIYGAEDAAQAKAMLKARYAAQDAAQEKARYAAENVAQLGLEHRPLPPPPRRWTYSHGPGSQTT